MKKKNTLLAVIIGVLTVVITTTVVDIIMHSLGVFPPLGIPMNDSQAALALAYRTVIGIVGGYVTAKLSQQNPMRNALILGLIGFIVGGVGALTLGEKAPGPVWYSIAVAVLAIPQCWFGAKIYLKRG